MTARNHPGRRAHRRDPGKRRGPSPSGTGLGHHPGRHTDRALAPSDQVALQVPRDVTTVLNGKQALELLEEYKKGNVQRPDIIFLDLNMPIMNGYEFIEAFALMDLPDKNAITIVVLTSSADPNDLARAKELGIKYYFNKPLTKEEIKKMIGQEFSYDLN